MRWWTFAGTGLLLAPVAIQAAPQTWDPVTLNGVTSVPAGGFVVDTSLRMESLSFFNAVWRASEGATTRMGWTGSFGACSAASIGTTSAVFQSDVRRRINYYRALAGLPANITFDAEPVVNSTSSGSPQVTPATTKKQVCAQAAAYLNALSPVFFDPFSISHIPTAATTVCWSKNAWNGCFQSNLAQGFYGPRAIDEYIADDNVADSSFSNASAGHRRWVLFSRARDMSSGDVPPGSYTDASGTYPVLPNNALYVISSSPPLEAPARTFVTWPPKGFVPAALQPKRWSVSFPDAIFPATASAISLTGPSGAVPVTVLSYNTTGFGDNTLVFQPASLPPPGAADTPYTVTLSGISGPGVPGSLTWQTTFFDPDTTNFTQTITGPPQSAASGSIYTFTSVPVANAYQVQAAVASAPANFTENADSTNPAITGDKTGYYPILQGPASLNGASFAPRSGTRAFHLCFPADETEADYLPHPQSFTLNAEFIPAATSTLTFNELFRWLFTVNRFSIELSADGGTRWTEIYGRNGPSTFNPAPGFSYPSSDWDPAWKGRSVSLAPWAGQPILLRFILRPGPVTFDGADINHGCYLDDIVLTNVRRFNASPPVNLAVPGFRFDRFLTGTPLVTGVPWLIRVRPQIGTRFMGYSQPFTITPLPPTAFEAAYPEIAAQPQGDADDDGIPNLVEYAFALNPTALTSSIGLPQPVRTSSGLSLSFTVPPGRSGIAYGAECSSNLVNWTPVANTGTGSQRTFILPVTAGQKCLMRLRVTQSP